MFIVVWRCPYCIFAIVYRGAARLDTKNLQYSILCHYSKSHIAGSCVREEEEHATGVYHRKVQAASTPSNSQRRGEYRSICVGAWVVDACGRERNQRAVNGSTAWMTGTLFLVDEKMVPVALKADMCCELAGRSVWTPTSLDSVGVMIDGSTRTCLRVIADDSSPRRKTTGPKELEMSTERCHDLGSSLHYSSPVQTLAMRMIQSRMMDIPNRMMWNPPLLLFPRGDFCDFNKSGLACIDHQ